MDGEDATTATQPWEEEDEEGLGNRFFLKLFGILVGIAVLGLIGLLIFTSAVYAWGFFGALLVFAAAVLVWAWISDRRNARS